nr:MAG TPA: hypothetical protein [Caudoviricetes sp.]
MLKISLFYTKINKKFCKNVTKLFLGVEKFFK